MKKLRRTFTVFTAALVLGLGAASCVEEDPFAIEPPSDCSDESQKLWAFDTMQEVYLFNDQLVEGEVNPDDYEVRASHSA